MKGFPFVETVRSRMRAMAETRATSTEGLVAGEIKIGAISGYRAMPVHGEKFPVVLVVQEIYGVHEYIKDICRRFAKQGYLAIAPEFFARQGDVSSLKTVQEMLPVVSTVPDSQVMEDLDAAVVWAKNSGKGDPLRLVVAGFSWGGRIVWLYCAHNPHLKAGVAWYGPVVKPATELQPRHPIDVAGELKCPVLGLYGGEDAGIPNDTVERMQAALAAAGRGSEIHLYAGMPHAFHADYRPSYRKEAADDGWRRMLDWFRRHGVA